MLGDVEMQPTRASTVDEGQHGGERRVVTGLALWFRTVEHEECYPDENHADDLDEPCGLLDEARWVSNRLESKPTAPVLVATVDTHGGGRVWCFALLG